MAQSVYAPAARRPLLDSAAPRFRADVQALRAIAVLGVVLYHLWPTAVRGGFVGVDVFFVISGFLITQQLVDEVQLSGRISLRRFWARRIRRILPAAMTVLASSTVFLILVMPRLEWQRNLEEIRAATAYVENWLLGVHAVNYLAAENTPSLVQHYWSLSVEEQFYLFWPLLVAATVMLTRLVPGLRARWSATLITVLTLVAAASFLVSVVWTLADQPMAFFATQTRAWEFAVGGIAASVGRRTSSGRRAKNSRGGLRAVTAWLGLSIVAYSCFGVTGAVPFPGWVAAVPVVGAALLIRGGDSSARWSAGRVLAGRPLQWLGDNSYSIYLWHWPLIIAAPWLTHRPLDTTDKVILLIGSLLLAGATKRFVEDPARTARRWQLRAWPAYAFGAAGIAGLVAVSTGLLAQVGERQHTTIVAGQAENVALLKSHPSCFGAAAILPTNHCPQAFLRPPHLDLAFATADGPHDSCLQNSDAATPSMCIVGATKDYTKTIAVVGNSHAWRLVPAVAAYGRSQHWRFVVASRINCLGVITTPITSRGASPNCLRWSARLRDQLLSMKLDGVIFAGYRYADQFIEGLDPATDALQAAEQQVLATWSTFAAHRIPVMVVGDVPGMRPHDDPECIAESAAANDPCAIARQAIVRTDLLSTLAQQHPQLARYIPLTQYFCDARSCHALIGGVVVYFDSHHMTTTFARSLAPYLGADIRAALQVTNS